MKGGDKKNNIFYKKEKNQNQNQNQNNEDQIEKYNIINLN